MVQPHPTGHSLWLLTAEVENFYNQCDPDKENLCLYGAADLRVAAYVC